MSGSEDDGESILSHSQSLEDKEREQRRRVEGEVDDGQNGESINHAVNHWLRGLFQIVDTHSLYYHIHFLHSREEKAKGFSKRSCEKRVTHSFAERPSSILKLASCDETSGASQSFQLTFFAHGNPAKSCRGERRRRDQNLKGP